MWPFSTFFTTPFTRDDAVTLDDLPDFDARFLRYDFPNAATRTPHSLLEGAYISSTARMCIQHMRVLVSNEAQETIQNFIKTFLPEVAGASS